LIFFIVVIISNKYPPEIEIRADISTQECIPTDEINTKKDTKPSNNHSQETLY